MSTFTKIKLSGSTNGRCIQMVGAATTIHTAVTGTSDLDEVYIYAANNHSASVVLTIEWGDAAATDLVEETLEAKKGAYLIIPGWPIQNGLLVRGFASVDNVVNINGYVHRIEA